MQDERHETRKKMYHIYTGKCSSFLLPSTILINYTHKKKKHVHREITLDNKTRLNKNNYVTKTMKNKHMKHLTKKII